MEFSAFVARVPSGCSSSQLASQIPRKNDFGKEIHVHSSLPIIPSFSVNIVTVRIMEGNLSDIPGTYLSFVLGVEPSKRRPKFQSKQGSFGFQVYIYIIYNIYI